MKGVSFADCSLGRDYIIRAPYSSASPIVSSKNAFGICFSASFDLSWVALLIVTKSIPLKGYRTDKKSVEIWLQICKCSYEIARQAALTDIYLAIYTSTVIFE